VADEGFRFEFAKQPVIAVRLPWAFDLRVGERPKPFPAGMWLVVNADGSMHLLPDATFRRLYSPVGAGAVRYLASLEPIIVNEEEAA
jgi:hypothetical protein